MLNIHASHHIIMICKTNYNDNNNSNNTVCKTISKAIVGAGNDPGGCLDGLRACGKGITSSVI